MGSNWRRALVAFSLSSVTAAGPVAARPAGASLSFTAVAAADGLRLTMSSPGSPGTDTPLDGGGPSAQAVVASTGTSQAFASLPYPGEVAVTLPGLLAAVGVAGVPDYPFYRATDFPTRPDADLNGPGYRLTAASREQESKAAAAAGSADPAVALFDARATVSGIGDHVRATATSAASSLQIGDLVIGKAASRAEVLVTADGRRERSADFVVTGMAISGTAIVVGPDGLHLAGTHQPRPDSSALTTLLAQHHLELVYLAQEETPDGILSGGLRITTGGEVPGMNGTLRVTLGRAAASVQAGSDPPADAVSDVRNTTGSPSGVGAPGGPPPVGPIVQISETPPLVQATPANHLSGDTGRSSASTTPAPRELTAPNDSASPVPGVLGGAAPTEPASRRAALRRSFDGARFYPMLLLAAGLAYAAIGASSRLARGGK